MALIRSLRCERLASNEENLRLIDSFYSTRNNNVADALLNEAYQEDESGVVAYYGVKDSDGNVLFFFSLVVNIFSYLLLIVTLMSIL